MRVPELNAKLAQQAVEVVQSLRQMDLKKQPSVAETIDWAKALVMLNADSLDQHTLETTLTVLLKHEADAQRAKRALSSGDMPRRGGGRDLASGLGGGSRPSLPPSPFAGLGGGRGRRG